MAGPHSARKTLAMSNQKGNISVQCQNTKNSVPAFCALRLNASARGQNGVALAIVVWFIAGMSLLVAGIVSHARVDTQMAQLHVARAKAVAAGDGAIQLMLGERFFTDGRTPDEQDMLSGVYELGGAKVSVLLVPAAALVDINQAPQSVLASLLLIVAQVPDGEANFLAENVVKWRLTNGPFREIEDVLRVSGMNRAIFEAVRDFVAAQDLEGAGADQDMLSAALLQVANQMEPGEMNELALRSEMLSRSNADAARQDNESSLSGSYRADALVTYGDQIWLRRRWIAVGSAVGSALPWQIVRTEPPRIYESSNEVL